MEGRIHFTRVGKEARIHLPLLLDFLFQLAAYAEFDLFSWLVRLYTPFVLLTCLGRELENRVCHALDCHKIIALSALQTLIFHASKVKMYQEYLLASDRSHWDYWRSYQIEPIPDFLCLLLIEFRVLPLDNGHLFPDCKNSRCLPLLRDPGVPRTFLLLIIYSILDSYRSCVISSHIRIFWVVIAIVRSVPY
jgi:hypothetical protein